MTKAIETAVLQELERGQPLKARVIARETNLLVSDVNSVLYGALRGRVKKNEAHEWTLIAAPLRVLKEEAKSATSKPKFSIKSHVVKEN